MTGSPTRYVVTPALRRKLKQPVGTLYRTNQLKRPPFLLALRSSPFVTPVGDRVTETLQALGRTPDVQVVDEVERRVRRTPPEAPYVRLVRASNPAGTITAEAIEAVRNAMGGEKPARVLIEGEDYSPCNPGDRSGSPRRPALLRAAGRGSRHGPGRRKGKVVRQVNILRHDAGLACLNAVVARGWEILRGRRELLASRRHRWSADSMGTLRLRRSLPMSRRPSNAPWRARLPERDISS